MAKSVKVEEGAGGVEKAGQTESAMMSVGTYIETHPGLSKKEQFILKAAHGRRIIERSEWDKVVADISTRRVR
jgi:hypothetical protein